MNDMARTVSKEIIKKLRRDRKTVEMDAIYIDNIDHILQLLQEFRGRKYPQKLCFLFTQTYMYVYGVSFSWMYVVCYILHETLITF